MREISAGQITGAVRNMCIEANCLLGSDLRGAIEKAEKAEISPTGREMLRQINENIEIARRDMVPICQDTGLAVVFVEIGQEVHIAGGSLREAINEGVRRGYSEGYLRKSVVADPFMRVNTGDNTPAVIHYEIVEGDSFKIEIAPKGAGSENMSKIFMLKPADGIEGAKKAVLETVEAAGGNPCPPMVVGVGCGGNFETAALLAKKALLRPIGSHNKNRHIQEMEEALLAAINKTGIGPQGLGGMATALGVNIETAPTHIACMPVAVNISCHVTRHAECRL